MRSHLAPSIRLYICLVSIATIVTILQTSCSGNIKSRVENLVATDENESSEEIQKKLLEYKLQVKENPRDAEAVGNLGIVFELHGYPTEALEAYDIASTLAPTELKWPYYHAILLDAKFDLSLAIEKVNEAILRRPDYSPALLRLGDMLLKAGRYQEALDSFHLAEQEGGDRYAILGQALALMELNDLERSLEVFDRLSTLDEHPHARRIKAKILKQSGKAEQAANLLRNSDHVSTVRWRDPVEEEKALHVVDHFGMKLARAGRFIEARAYESALFALLDLKTMRPQNKQVLHLLSSVYIQLNRDAEARQVLEEGIEQHPDYYVLRTSMAGVLHRAGEHGNAVEHLDFAIEIAPSLHWAYLQKAQILMYQKQWLRASHVLDQAIGTKPDNVELYTLLGICLGFLNRWPEAASMFQVAASIDPTHVPVHINLARAHAILGNEESVQTSLDAAVLHGASNEMLQRLKIQLEQINFMNIQLVQKDSTSVEVAQE